MKACLFDFLIDGSGVAEAKMEIIIKHELRRYRVTLVNLCQKSDSPIHPTRIDFFLARSLTQSRYTVHPEGRSQ